MKAITTKYIGPSNVRGSRYKAIAEGGHSITLGADNALNSEENHSRVARALADKMKWKGKLLGGGMPDGRGYAFVFEDTNVRASPKRAKATREVEMLFDDLVSTWRRSWGDNRKSASRHIVKAVKEHPSLKTRISKTSLERAHVYAQQDWAPRGASPKRDTGTRQHLKTIRPHVELYRDPRTGIAWIENGSAGTGHSCHSNISGSGSAAGMIRSGRWDKGDKFVRSHGFLYNVSHCITSGELDKIACKACRCGGAHGCAGSPRRGQRHAHSRQNGGNALGSLAHKAASKVAKLFTSKKGR